MMWSEEPVYVNRFTANDLDEILSFLQAVGNEDRPVSSNSGSDEPPNGGSEDEKKKKRKISNRESAKRSRWRKKRHLEDLNAKVSQLKAQNREYKNRLSFLLHQLHIVRSQNDRFRFESLRLLQRHSQLNRVLQARQLI